MVAIEDQQGYEMTRPTQNDFANFDNEDSSQRLLLSKAQFAVLLSKVIGFPFTLNNQALEDLEMASNDIETAKRELIRLHLYDAAEDSVPESVASLLRRTMSKGWKAIVQIQSRRPVWQQLAVHLDRRPLLGEAVYMDGNRLLIPLLDEEMAASWLLSLVAEDVEARAVSEQTRPLASLLPNAQQIALMIVANSRTEESHEALLWLVAEQRLWIADRTSDKMMRSTGLSYLAEALRSEFASVIQPST